MTTYLDTSFLIKLYLLEIHSPLAESIQRAQKTRSVISWLTSVEMSTALHRSPEHRLPGLNSGLVDIAYKQFQLDQDAGIYSVVSVDQHTFEIARTIGERHGLRYFARALDVLHIASALRHGIGRFATFDEKQARLAAEVGLQVLP